MKAAFLATSFALVSLSPSLAASNFFGPPPGITLVNGSPNNFLQLRSSGKKIRLDAKYMRQVVPYRTELAVGTVVVNTGEKFLYLVLGKGKALRYGIGTAKDGFEWSGTHKITRKAEWPGWTPPAEMKKRRPDLPDYMAGGPNNPLGARALYIGSTLYRIHGTNEPWTIGGDVSSGCIRMVNDDVVDLYARVKIGAKVIVL
ncbi:MAG: L,D-transpeptidase [Hyphomicrobiales bacterium]|nr:MAG: L,D-transpeptidase [Hyphomicrobiales bacterium]